MAISVRMNPLRSAMPKPLGAQMPQIGMGKIGESSSGPTFAHLGHFGQPSILRAGHNSNGHPGFKAVQSSISSKEHVSKKAAGAILAKSTRRASAKAKRKNPRLKRVK